MGNNSDADSKKPKDFTVDNTQSGVVEMPSITTLLDRKTGSKLIKARKDKEQKEVEKDFKIQLDTNDIQDSIAPIEKNKEKTASTQIPISIPQVQKSKKMKGSRAAQELIKWEKNIVQKSQDPILSALKKIITAGGKSALYLSVKIADSKTQKVFFEATAAYADPDQFVLWKGMKWDPHVVAELWNHFVKHGATELSPPGTVTHMASSRNVVRGVFGAKREEWLTLFRVGSAASCRGILAILSKNSLQPAHAEILVSLDLTSAATS